MNKRLADQMKRVDHELFEALSDPEAFLEGAPTETLPTPEQDDDPYMITVMGQGGKIKTYHAGRLSGDKSRNIALLARATQDLVTGNGDPDKIRAFMHTVIETL